MQQRREPIRRALLRVRQDMRVGVQRRLHVAVSQALRDDVHRFAAEQEQRRTRRPGFSCRTAGISRFSAALDQGITGR